MAETDGHRIGHVIGHVDEIDDIGERHRLAVDARAAEEPNRSFGDLERRRDIAKAFGTGKIAPGDHQVAPPRKRATSERLPRDPPHDERRAHGERFTRRMSPR